MSDVRPTMHQPPNPDDLRRAPPAGPECARVRGLLRDFADGDLPRSEHRQVEEHVHTCFTCSVELSRAEHEVLRLRRGFARIAAARTKAESGLPADFARRLVDRIVDDEPSHVGMGGAEVVRAVDADRAGVPERELPARTPPVGIHQHGARHRSMFLLLSAALVLVCFGALAMWTLASDHEPDVSARLVVMRAKGAFGDAGRRLAIGDGLGESQWLKVGAGGSALFDWHDLSSGSQPAATLEMSGRGRLRLQRGAPLLLDGTVAIETNRSVDIPVADGSKVQLGIGDYVIIAESPLLADDYLAQLRDPMRSAPADLRIQIEVLRGDPAVIVRSDVGPTLVAAGSIGVYAGGSEALVVPSGTQVAAVDGARRAGPTVTPPPVSIPTLSTSVYQRSGLPSVGTLVAAVFAANGSTVMRASATNAYGSVVLSSEAPFEGDFAVLRAVPAQAEYGVVAPDAFPLLREGAHVRTEQSLVLDLSEPLLGQVIDESGQPPQGVRVLPCIHDELFGDVFPINPETDFTVPDEQGRFRINRLPSTLPRYQHLVLVLVHPQFEPTVVPVPVRGGGNAAMPMPPIVLKSLATVKLHWLTPNSQVILWEELPVLQGGRAVYQRVFQADHLGKVHAARIGRGSLWWVVGAPGNAIVHEMMFDGTEAEPRFRPRPVPGTPQAMQFRPLDNLPGTDLYLAQSFRHQRFDLPTATSAATGFTMVVRDGLERPVANAQVFAVTPTGPRVRAEARFLGLTSVQGVISIEPVRYEGDLVVIAPDGSIAFESQPQQSYPLRNAQLRASGRVLLGPSLRPDPATGPAVVAIHCRRQLEGMSGVEVTSVRFASEATGWEIAGIAPGFYFVQVGDQGPRPLVVPEGGFEVLQ